MGHVYEPIIFLTEAYLVDHDDPRPGSRPVFTNLGAAGVRLSVTIGNKATALTDISLNIPIAIYKNGVVSEENYIGTYLLSQFDYGTSGIKVNSAIKAGTEQRISIALPLSTDVDANSVFVSGWVTTVN